MAGQTSSTIDVLRKLHRIHRQLGDLAERLEGGPRKVRVRQNHLQQLEAEVHRLESEAKRLGIETDNKQLDLRTAEQKIQRRRDQLQQSANNREYQALRDQIAADEKAASVLADEILEGLEKLDQYKERIAQAKTAVDQAREQLESLRRDVEAEAPRLKAEVERLQAEREQCEQSLPSEFRELYERATRSKGEDALAPLSGQYCSGCNQHVPVNKINDLMLAKPVTCQVCGRLLYLPENYELR